MQMKKPWEAAGKPLLVQQDGTVWLLSSLVSTYTNVRIEAFDTDGVHRVFGYHIGNHSSLQR